MVYQESNPVAESVTVKTDGPSTVLKEVDGQDGGEGALAALKESGNQLDQALHRVSERTHWVSTTLPRKYEC